MRRTMRILILGILLATINVLSFPATASAELISCEDGREVEVVDTATADQRAEACGDVCSGSWGLLGIPTWYKYLELGLEGNDNCAIIGPKNANGDLDMAAAAGLVALAVIEILLRLAVLVSFAFVMIGGFRYITTQGEPENAKSARQTITNSLIGLAITLVATGAVAFIANRLTS